VTVVKGKLWPEDQLRKTWFENRIPGWGYRPYAQKAVTAAAGDPTNIGEQFFPVKVKLNPGLVGSHARNCTQNSEKTLVGEKLCNRYRVEEIVGAGHFTRALLAYDEETDTRVCVKKHNSITIELLTDLLTVGRRLKSVDQESKFFPQLFDAFYDIDGYTVESLISGKNCLLVMRDNPEHFKNFDNLRRVAKQGYQGLVYMAEAGVVHCDLKPDNIMWIEPIEPGQEPSVILVDFGCSRLDCRLEDGRNWALSEGGAGHVGKWAPEMILRLPITHKADVWGLAVALLELHCGRATWTGESDTVEVILAQVLGLVNARSGLPVDLLRRSPLDIQQLYTPFPTYFPMQRMGIYGQGARFQELRPATWGLGCVLGEEDKWDEIRIIFADFVLAAMSLDHEKRPSAAEMLKRAFISPTSAVIEKILEDWRNSERIVEKEIPTTATEAKPSTIEV
jgi:serine/threonine protein kinase